DRKRFLQQPPSSRLQPPCKKPPEERRRSAFPYTVGLPAGFSPPPPLTFCDTGGFTCSSVPAPPPHGRSLARRSPSHSRTLSEEAATGAGCLLSPSAPAARILLASQHSGPRYQHAAGPTVRTAARPKPSQLKSIKKRIGSFLFFLASSPCLNTLSFSCPGRLSLPLSGSRLCPYNSSISPWVLSLFVYFRPFGSSALSRSLSSSLFLVLRFLSHTWHFLSSSYSSHNSLFLKLSHPIYFSHPLISTTVGTISPQRAAPLSRRLAYSSSSLSPFSLSFPLHSLISALPSLSYLPPPPITQKPLLPSPSPAAPPLRLLSLHFLSSSALPHHICNPPSQSYFSSLQFSLSSLSLSSLSLFIVPLFSSYRSTTITRTQPSFFFFSNTLPSHLRHSCLSHISVITFSSLVPSLSSSLFVSFSFSPSQLSLSTPSYALIYSPPSLRLYVCRVISYTGNNYTGKMIILPSNPSLTFKFWSITILHHLQNPFSTILRF
ncbi:hypothetical protein C7M84_020742, partial [Penaeus vannamei]